MKTKLLLIILLAQFGFAQNRSCGTAAKMQEIMANPELRQQYMDNQARFEAKLQQRRMQRAANPETANVAEILRVPVAVHFPAGNNANRACLVALAQSQVDVLNGDFNAANADLSNWTAASTFYPGVVPGNLQVEFVLATENHPAGTDPNLVNGQPAVTVGYNYGNGGDSDATWDGYLNFLVKDIGSGLLGYSPLGGLPINGDAVVMNTFCFGTGSGCAGFAPEAPFHLGRTVTHELGHFFNLDHTFANDNGCGADDDGIADTPKVGFATYGCPANGSVPSCVFSKPALTMNFMDYVDDPCMYMFTAGQAQYANTYLDVIESQLNQNVLAVKQTAITTFAVTPNPNNGTFTIRFKEAPASYAIAVYDVTGRRVFGQSVAENSGLTQNIQLANASKGIYLINITADNKTTTRKMIVE